MKKNYDNYMDRALKKIEQTDDPVIYAAVNPDLGQNKLVLSTVFKGSVDATFKDFIMGASRSIRGFAFYIAGLVDEDMLAQHVLHSLLKSNDWILTNNMSSTVSVLDVASERIISFGKVEKAENFQDIVQAIINGCAAIFLDGCDSALTIDLEKRASRSISTPPTEASVFGPHQSFVEDVKTNIALLRNIVRTPRLIVEKYNPHHGIKTPIYLLYLRGVANLTVLELLHKRLDAMKMDLILDTTSIKELISDKQSFPFNTIGITERPDKAAAKLMEGKIAILADGSPLAITVPYLFIEEFHNAEDYYAPAFFASFSRLVRIISFIITIFIVPLYVAIATFHQEMFPLTLLITAAASREGIPFPTFLEAMLMTFVFDILREAGIRAPRQVGQTTSFIGALIIGTAAVEAGIVSAPMVIIIALTGITAIMNYPMKNIIIFFRSILLIFSACFGFLGIEMVSIVILIRLCSIHSFGIPYLSPMATLGKNGLIKDTFWRFPMQWMSSFSSPAKRNNS